MERDNKQDLLVTLAVLVVVVFIVAAAVVKNKKPAVTTVSSETTTSTSMTPAMTTDTTTTTQTPATTSTGMTGMTGMASGYKDGTYTATSQYYTPGQSESITVKVTLKDGVVTDTSTTATAYDRDSRAYSNVFVQSYKPYVVGKSIASLRLSRVSGASLTSQGFNDAIATIQTQAKS